MNWVRVTTVENVPLREGRAVRVGDDEIAIFNLGDRFVACENACPHRGGPLAEGDLIGDEIVCPWHLWGFDVRSGLCPGNAEFAIATHEVKIESDRILVKLSPVRETSGAL